MVKTPPSEEALLNKKRDNRHGYLLSQFIIIIGKVSY